MSDEWGPWIEHDGKGCPFEKGTWVMSESREGLVAEHAALCFIAHPELPLMLGTDAWTWREPLHPDDIIRYRIRKPRALLNLIERARELDDAPQGPVRAPASPKVDA